MSQESFGAAFAREHNKQGAKGKFKWNGKWYSTARADGRDLRAERLAKGSRISKNNDKTGNNKYIVPVDVGSNGLNLIKSFEGLRLTCYLPTPNDIATTGYENYKQCNWQRY